MAASKITWGKEISLADIKAGDKVAICDGAAERSSQAISVMPGTKEECRR